MAEATGGFARTYGVELLCENHPALSPKELLRAIRTHCPSAEPLDKGEEVHDVAVGQSH